jgi:hypothetical protein
MEGLQEFALPNQQKVFQFLTSHVRMLAFALHNHQVVGSVQAQEVMDLSLH